MGLKYNRFQNPILLISYIYAYICNRNMYISISTHITYNKHNKHTSLLLILITGDMVHSCFCEFLNITKELKILT